VASILRGTQWRAAETSRRPGSPGHPEAAERPWSLSYDVSVSVSSQDRIFERHDRKRLCLGGAGRIIQKICAPWRCWILEGNVFSERFKTNKN
jgi:hypothetical protein